ncbi:hypothetical protein BN129_2923 [Cronobacter sakazakii 701]|nr:hypothetical protein BN129_2923 [Cronobacter sakazakii 701]
MNSHAHAFDFTAQLLAAHLVKLFGHQHRREFNHVRFDAQVFQRARGFQTEQTAANHRAAFAATRAGFNRVQIFDGAVNEAVLGVGAFNRRDPRVGAGRHDQFVVEDGAPGAGVDHFLLAVNGDGALAHQDFHTVLVVVAFTDQRQLFRGVMGEIRGEVHAVIGDARLLTEDGDVELAWFGFIEKVFDKAVTNHAVTDNSESDFAHFCLDFFSITAYLNDSAPSLIDVNQLHLCIPLNGYIVDFSGIS